MAIPSIVVGRTWPAGTTEANYLQGGATIATMSANSVSGTATTAPTDNFTTGAPVVIKAFGTRFAIDLSTSVTIRVKRLNLVTDTWDVVFTGAVIAAHNHVLTGLYPYQDNGVSGIFVAYMSTATAPVIAKTTDGVAWSVAVVGTILGMSLHSFGRPHMYRNKLIACLQHASNIVDWVILDPAGMTLSVISTVSDGAIAANAGIHLTAMCATFNNRLFMVFTRASATPHTQIYELAGGVWASIVSLGANTVISLTAIIMCSHALVPYGSTRMVALVKTDSGGTIGTRAFNLTPNGQTFDVLEVSTTIIPPTLRVGGGGGSNSQRWTGFVDDVTDPANPTVHFFLMADDITGNFTYYDYGTGAGIMTSSGGPAVNYQLPHATVGGGAYIAAANDMDVRNTSQTAILAGTRIGYVASGLITALSRRFSVRLATAAGLPFSPTQSGTGVGKTIFATVNGILTIDGVTAEVGTRVLVKNESTPSSHGIYVVTTVGTASTTYLLTRAVDFDSAAEIFTGTYVAVGDRGTTNANTRWQLTTSNPIVVDTTELSFSSISPTGTLRRSPCRVATTTGLPSYTPIGSGLGKMLTANAVGVLTIDGVNTVLGNRILVNHHAADNGIYIVTTEGTGGAAFVLTRATDFDEVAVQQIMPSAYTYVSEGTTNGNQFWELTTNGQITVDSTSLTFTSRAPISLRLYYNIDENTDMSQGTLSGTATGGDSIRNGNQIDRISPDGIEPFTVDWKAGVGGDGLQNGQAVNAFLRLNV